MNPTQEPEPLSNPVDFREIFVGSRILPLLVIDNPELARTLLETLFSSGIKVAEIALRTPESLLALKLATQVTGVRVGAGTVLTVDQVNKVADAGAKFVVCPSFDEAVVDRALQLGLPVLPGVATASEVHKAVNKGLAAVKFFPADSLGGLRAIDSFSGPFPNMSFVPSGGVSETNFESYLRHPCVPAVSGSWIAPRNLIENANFAEIARISSQAVSALELAKLI